MRQLKIVQSITSRDSLSLEKYLQEIKKYSLLSHEEEVELARLIKDGDKNAATRLVNANLHFCRFRGQTIPGPGTFFIGPD